MEHRFEHHHWQSWGHGPGPSPDLFPSMLSTVFWAALFIGLALLVLRWILPYMMPMLTDIFGTPSEKSSALEILHRRYAAGEIDADTFEQMRERLEASFSPGSNGIPHHSNGYVGDTWTGYRATLPPPASRGRGIPKMAEQEHYPYDSDS